MCEALTRTGMDNGVNLFGKMKGIHQERLKADSISEITTEIKKDISALDNNMPNSGMIPNHIYQAQKEKAKEILFEILEEIRA
ncbi:hypothetical protein [Helicobacter pullorum]|uniref:hypothetical protein n=1 Tax=Helicobacter pullorum TaxID=35818 RepID=UPI0006CCFD9B|nr:hypothetical protein [Helicobacter pullorum]KPH53114.1 hypothetical protein HPU229254_01445 [Helicobacter pullorum]